MGLTETAAQILSNPLPPGLRKIGSPGVAYGNDICIMDVNLTQMKPNERGEIAVRGPNVMREYFKNPNATKEAITPDGWLRSGDLGYMDDDGYIFVTGRLKELIIKGGENIAPREIDDVLYTHRDVVEAAAYSEPCNTYGEKVMAAVKIAAHSDLNEEFLMDLCKDKLGAFKSPDRIYFLDELPKGPSGKIQRAKISDIVGS
jgi:acyl-CoA synthetase (AMP-forming)/AMP-acid ligase II